MMDIERPVTRKSVRVWSVETGFAVVIHQSGILLGRYFIYVRSFVQLVSAERLS
jgi:hypothetical protein